MQASRTTAPLTEFRGGIVFVPRNQVHFVDPGTGKIGYFLVGMPSSLFPLRRRLLAEGLVDEERNRLCPKGTVPIV